MRINIGMVAWNEEGSINLAIKSLFRQTIFKRYQKDIELIKFFVLANGCTDNTVKVANTAIGKYLNECRLSYISAKVLEYKHPSKAITWNRFVHEVSDNEADYLFMMDADIEINNTETCWILIKSLEDNQFAYASGATAIKDLFFKKPKTITDRISLAMTDMEHNARFTHLAGGLFCGRSSFLRKIWIPNGMLSIDGFINSLAKTSFLTSEEIQHNRILAPRKATFLFEAYDRLNELYPNHCRRYAGKVIHNIIFSDFSETLELSKFSQDASDILRDRYLSDHDWMIKLISNRIQSLGWGAFPWQTITLRWSQFKLQPLNKKVFRWPLVLIGTIWQGAVLIGSYRTLKKGEIFKIWKDTQNRRLIDEGITDHP
jgi:glycosyltransferase involved in cell wall biosynthesis